MLNQGYDKSLLSVFSSLAIFQKKEGGWDSFPDMAPLFAAVHVSVFHKSKARCPG